MDKIKEAFQKIKEDILILNEELNYLKSDILILNEKFDKLNENLLKKQEQKNQTDRHINKTDSAYISTDNIDFKPLNDQNLSISIRNEGVQTDRQTHRQTDRHIEKKDENKLDKALEILNSLDNIKKEIRLQFKRLTEQEFLIFSSIYQLEEENGYAEYRALSNKLHLTESSIRDYVGRLIKKGIPIEKYKINNKTIHLKISENLKNIVSLPLIMQLRDL